MFALYWQRLHFWGFCFFWGITQSVKSILLYYEWRFLNVNDPETFLSDKSGQSYERKKEYQGCHHKLLLLCVSCSQIWSHTYVACVISTMVWLLWVTQHSARKQGKQWVGIRKNHAISSRDMVVVFMCTLALSGIIPEEAALTLCSVCRCKTSGSCPI